MVLLFPFLPLFRCICDTFSGVFPSPIAFKHTVYVETYVLKDWSPCLISPNSSTPHYRGAVERDLSVVVIVIRHVV